MEYFTEFRSKIKLFESKSQFFFNMMEKKPRYDARYSIPYILGKTILLLVHFFIIRKLENVLMINIFISPKATKIHLQNVKLFNVNIQNVKLFIVNIHNVSLLNVNA